jgi:hypothetical protein
MLAFSYNGIKDNSGKLQKAKYHAGAYTPESGLSENTITIIARKYEAFSAEISETFTVVNHTDAQTDVFDRDRICVSPVSASQSGGRCKGSQAGS